LAHGLGIFRHRDGTTYQGQFENDLQHGFGLEGWPDRSRFKGQFVLGKKSAPPRNPSFSAELGHHLQMLSEGKLL
jgi:hypothetical protein